MVQLFITSTYAPRSAFIRAETCVKVCHALAPHAATCISSPVACSALLRTRIRRHRVPSSCCDVIPCAMPPMRIRPHARLRPANSPLAHALRAPGTSCHWLARHPFVAHGCGPAQGHALPARAFACTPAHAEAPQVDSGTAAAAPREAHRHPQWPPCVATTGNLPAGAQRHVSTCDGRRVIV
jgi:hypothetical protein